MPISDEQRKRRRQRGAEAVRALLVEAAASVFAHKGYHGTKIEDIAKASGYSPAAIYKYFSGKEELFSQLWNTMAEALQGIFVESTNVDLPFTVRLRWLLTSIGKLLETSPDMLVAFIAQRPYVAHSAQSDLERQAFAHYRQHVEQIAALMQQGIDEGALRPGDPEDFALLFIGLLYEVAFRLVTSDPPFDIPAAQERLLELFLRGAGHPGATPAPGESRR